MSEANKKLSTPEAIKQPTGRIVRNVTATLAAFGVGAFNRMGRLGPIRRFKTARSNLSMFGDGYERRSDAKENARGRLPADEGLQTPAVWIAELYTPSEVEGFLRGLAQLGWDRTDHRPNELSDWMRNVREGRSAGWINAGIVVPPGKNRILAGTIRRSQLPEGVSSAWPVLMSITPGITAMVMGFMLDQNTASAIETPMRKEYRTVTRAHRSQTWLTLMLFVLFNRHTSFGQSIYSPDLLRRDETDAVVAMLERRCIAWVRQNLPGVFASTLTQSRSPTAVLMVTEQVRADSKEEETRVILDPLRLHPRIDGWQSQEWPGARMFMRRSSDDETLRMVFMCRRRDAFPDNAYTSEPTSNHAIAHRTHEQIDTLMSRWALIALLDGYHESLARLRDRVATKRAFKTQFNLTEVLRLARTTLFDAEVVAHELQEYAKQEWEFDHDVLALTLARVHEEPELLTKRLRRSIAVRADRLSHEAHRLQNVLSIASNLSQSIQNLILQRITIVLAVTSVVLAVVAILVSIADKP